MDNTSTVTRELIEDSGIQLTGFTYCLFIASAGVCAILQYVLRSKTSDLPLPAANEIAFKNFQRKYFAAYFFTLFGDWLHIPYRYKLYVDYDFSSYEIAVLYAVGFSSRALFGTIFDVIANFFGRKKTCMFFLLIYSLCSVMNICTNYYVLLLGMLLQGMSTSVLHSVIEIWYLDEHDRNYFPVEWTTVTSCVVAYWNGVMAILAGIIAYSASELLGFGSVAPFLLSIPFFVISGVIMAMHWRENYGEKKLKKCCSEDLKVIFSDKFIFMLGLIQSLFECVMCVFVFLWTPLLDPKQLPLGLAFSIFMVYTMIGSSIYQFSEHKKMEPQTLLLVSTLLAVISQGGCAVSTSFSETNIFLAFSSFILLQVATGIYCPSVGCVKSKNMPEAYSNNLMTWFRLPVNVMICVILLLYHGRAGGNCIIYLFSSGMMVCCACIVIILIKTIPSISKLALPV